MTRHAPFFLVHFYYYAKYLVNLNINGNVRLCHATLTNETKIELGTPPAYEAHALTTMSRWSSIKSGLTKGEKTSASPFTADFANIWRSIRYLI